MLRDTIAIDFDDTFTSDINLWYGIIQRIQDYGYTVICATARGWSQCNEDGLKAVLPPRVEVVFCGTTCKRTACQNAGYNVTIWIDDTPAAIEPNQWINWIRLKMCFWKLYYALLRKLCPTKPS
jgi:hypothetical protein